MDTFFLSRRGAAKFQDYLQLTLRVARSISSKMICPQCIGSSGGRKTATKYKNRLSTWGKMGGRGKKNGLSLSRRAVPFEKGK
jgi:hypothetical protein